MPKSTWRRWTAQAWKQRLRSSYSLAQSMHSTLELLRGFVMDEAASLPVQPDVAPGALRVGNITGAHRSLYLSVRAQQLLASAWSIYLARQFHTPLIHTRAVGLEPVAWLCDAAGVATTIPAATVRRLGSSMVVAWSYVPGLKASCWRQGDPALAGDENDGLDGVRACETLWLLSIWIASPCHRSRRTTKTSL